MKIHESSSQSSSPALGFWFYTIIVGVFFLSLIVVPFIGTINERLYHTLFSLYRFTCHQMPERSFFLFGYQMPVCSRDTGFYLGMLLSTLFVARLSGTRTVTFPPWWVFIAFVFPMAIDGGTQLLATVIDPRLYWLSPFGLSQSFNELRFVTGFLAGTGVTLYAVPLLNALFTPRTKN